MTLTPEQNERYQGRAKQGVVTLRDFDRGVIETMGAKIINDTYYLLIDGVEPPPGHPGVIVTYVQPEDLFRTYTIPLVSVSRDDISPATQRWHSYGAQNYRAPATSALPFVTPDGRKGFTRYEQAPQAMPFDFTYTINIYSISRSARSAANTILNYILRTYQPQASEVRVTDSIGDIRTYETQNMGISPLDEVAEVSERVVGFSLSLIVEGELDLTDPTVQAAVTQNAQVGLARR